MTATVLAQATDQHYNLLIGPVSLRVDAGSSLSYNDNINYAETGRQEDWIITPDVNFHGRWQVTELNVLTFDLGFGYQEFLLHPNYGGPQISHDSQAMFKIYVGDLTVTLSDTPALQNGAEDVGQLSNVGQFTYFSNAASIAVDWDIGDLTLTLGYSHSTFYVLESAYSYLDNQADSISSAVTIKFSKTLQAGFNASVSDTRYDQNVQNDSIGLTAGPFVTAQLSENLSANAQAGWQLTGYDQGGSNGDSSSIDSYYGSVGINHRINAALQHGLTVGREFIPGITSNYTDRIYANYMPTWHATSLFDIAPQFWWESLQDSSGPVSEKSTRFGASIAFGLRLTEHTSGTLTYNYVMKNSNLSSSSYYQDLISLGLSYNF